jgi:hypothetical protein
MEGGSWPLGFGVLDVAIPALGVVALIALIIGAIFLILSSTKKEKEQDDFSTTEEDTPY